MKLIKSILLLVLLLSQSLISLQNELQYKKMSERYKNRVYSSKRGKRSSSKKDGVSLSLKMESSEDLIDFTLGVMTSFFPPTAILYYHKSKLLDILTPCAKADKFESQSVKVEIAPSTVNPKWPKMNAKEKLKYCRYRKHFFSYYSQRSISWLMDECVVDNSDLRKLQSKVPRIRTIEQYAAECKYFKEMDCDMFKDGVDVLGFISTAMSFLKPIQDVLGCVFSMKSKILAINEFSHLTSVFATGGVLSVLGKVGGVAVQVLTLGIWGLVKSAYDLVKLSQQIYEFSINRRIELKSYLLGKITGEAINLGQSLLTGTRKRKRTKKLNN